MADTGKIVGVNGNMLTVEFGGVVTQNEVAYAILGETRLKCEVIRVRGDRADLQVFESTNDLKVGGEVEFADELLSVELGPGLLTQVYDGLQNPLPELAEQCGFFLERGIYLQALDRQTTWSFTPTAKVGDVVKAGDQVGWVPEGMFQHKIMVPFSWAGEWSVQSVTEAGEYNVDKVVATASNSKGDVREIKMYQTWPVKIAISCYKEKMLANVPMVTQTRTIDSFFPVATGGTFCTPGPFGAGKTVLQHSISQNAEADARTGRSLMDRSVIICNTSSMPVAAREASVYTAVTIAEYYRQMGLNTLLLADSTSRWAQALREMSGRLEEIPGDEAFPAYLESRIAEFYERAGLVKLNDGSLGSVTIGGSVSPAGGNFEEPVTQATLKVVGCFLGLSRERSDSRRYPAINPLESWSKYQSVVDVERLTLARNILRRGNEVNQMMKVVGEEGTHIEDFTIYLKSEFLDYVYLQQNTFDKVDGKSSTQRQEYVFDKVYEVLSAKFDFTEADAARSYFLELRQKFIDWNYQEQGSDGFKASEIDIDAKIKEHIKHA